jgi:hypothetical protein
MLPKRNRILFPLVRKNIVDCGLFTQEIPHASRN